MRELSMTDVPSYRVDIPPGVSGVWKVEKFEVRPADEDRQRLRAAINPHRRSSGGVSGARISCYDNEAVGGRRERTSGEVHENRRDAPNEQEGNMQQNQSRVRRLIEQRVAALTADLRPQIARHVEGMYREVIRDVTAALLGDAHAPPEIAGSPSGAVETPPIVIPEPRLDRPDVVQAVLGAALTPIEQHEGIRRRGAEWECVYCNRVFGPRRGAKMHVRACPKRPPRAAVANGAENQGKVRAQAPATPPRQPRVVRKVNQRLCIAPGCKQTSKGPRFHFLCDRHRDAKKREVRKWQKQYRGDDAR